METAQQVQNLTESIIRIYEKKVSAEMIEVACAINHLVEQATKHGWDKNYLNALEDLKKRLKMKNTIYELYRY